MTVAVQARPLERFSEHVFAALGADPDVAAEVARHLVMANLAGHDSHGVQRLKMYVDWADKGMVVPAARPEVVRETPVSVLVDGHRSFGHFSTLYLLRHCMDKADSTGLAVGVLRNPTHTGRMGTYSEAAVERGLICIATVGSSWAGHGLVAPFGGVGRTLGTNPWTIGIPAGPGEPPFLYDAATSTIAEGKVRLASFKGVPVAEGTVVDPSGHSTTDPEQLYQGGSLVPLGGTLAGHKGTAFSVAAALFGALGMIAGDEPDPAGAEKDYEGVGGAFVLVLSPSLFGDPAEYRRLVGQTLAELNATIPAAGVSEVVNAGEPERRSRRARLAGGIPLPDPVWEELTTVADRFRLQLPSPD
jgi:uncharacterized oxidoreductase